MKKERRETQLCKDPNMNIILGSHEMEKIAAQLEGDISRDKDLDDETREQLLGLTKRLGEAFNDLYVATNRPEKRLELTRKYRHNLLSVIRDDNNMILSTKNKSVTRELVGNKGYNLWVMKNELELNIPECLYLTTEYSKTALLDGELPEQANLMQLLLAFEGQELAVRSSGTESMPGMLDTFFLPKDHTAHDVFDAIRMVIESWNEPKAVKYRTLCDIDHTPNIAVVIQPKIASDVEGGYAGICFTRDVVNGQKGLNGEYVEAELGDKLASGEADGLPLSKLPSEITKELSEVGERLEKHYRQPQDIEWAYDGKQLFILQTRTAKLAPTAVYKIYMDFWDEGIITEFEELDDNIDLRSTRGAEKFRRDKKEKVEPIATGKTASPGYTHGSLVFINSTSRFAGAAKGNILLANMTTTDDLEQIETVDGVVTLKGGYTSHPAIVSRELKKPCIVSASDITIDNENKTAVIGGTEFKEGDYLTIIADTGEIYPGHIKVDEYYELNDRLMEMRKEWREAKEKAES